MSFDDIRPYKDNEVPEKLAQLLNETQFQGALSSIHPEIPFELLKKQLLQISSIKELQAKMIVPALENFLKKTVKNLDSKGLDNLDKNQNYLFVSTHRDIVMDSALMNYVLLKNGFNTAEIAIGDNLLSIPWVVDLVKLNKSFIVKRSLPNEQKLDASLQLSAYISHTLKEKKESIWIAQRSGRSKDGNDLTNPSLLKMFYLAENTAPFYEHIQSLNICPVSIAYEYNPCDVLTIPELIQTSKGEKYVKAPMEDVTHMLTGIQGYKGNVTVSFGKPINSSLDDLKEIKNRNVFFNTLAQRIDAEIHQTYELMPSNYIASDLLNASNEYKAKYLDEEKESFSDYMNKRLSKVAAAEELKRNLFLRVYANPVKNSKK
tara:strand:+ start:207 stop:1331 length:1125 start_codon:yes stop_codon:yes gene_type:complete